MKLLGVSGHILMLGLFCALFVPVLSWVTFGFFWAFDFFVLKRIEIFSFNNQYTASYFLIIGGMVVISLCLLVGAIRPFREATQYEYFFIKNKIEGNEAESQFIDKFQKMMNIFQNEDW